jgi:hypothetical protein
LMLIVALATPLPDHSESSQNPPQTTAPNAATANQQQTSQPIAPPTQDQVAAAKAKADAAAEADKQEARITQEVTKWSAIAQAASAVLVTVFTGVLVWYSHRGWQVATKAAEAATKSTEVAERVLIISERAYVDIGDWRFGGSGTQVGFRYRFKVTGRTPATIIGGTIQLTLHGVTGVPIGPHFDARFEQPITSQVVTDQKRPHQVVRFPGIPVQYLDAWRADPPGFHMYLTGEVRYRDALQNTPVHVRHFTVRYNPDGKYALQDPPGRGEIILGNYEDDERDKG